MITRLLNSPHFFTQVTIGLYVVNMVFYAWHGRYGNAWYWAAAAQITIAATWMTNR